MVFTLPTRITHGSKSRTRNASVHPRQYAEYNNYNSRNNRRNRNNGLWIKIEQMVWGQYNSQRSSRRIWYKLFSAYSWLRLFIRDNRKSSGFSGRKDRNRSNHRNFCYYYLFISLLTIGIPSYANEGETNNTSNPVAAATGNVTNQAVQFQNNGAPSRQVYGANNSCNGATLTFSPFYMGNHTKPFDENMNQRTYTIAENWGGQINFMFPLDRRGLAQCRKIAKRQEEKMRLDYELVRVLKCAELQRKGFMLAEGTLSLIHI